MRYAVVVVVSLLVGGVSLPVAARQAAAQPVATFRSSVSLVPISAVVRDNRGRLVTTLSADDFQVFDKGERRRIVDFQRDLTGPLTVAVLLDVSGSMRIGPKLALAADVLRALSAALRDGQDEVALFTFDSALQERQAFTTQTARVRNGADDAEPFGTTSLYDAIAETARRVAARPASRRAVLVLTDGVDTSSAMTPSEVSGVASSIDVPVYVIAAVPAIDHVLAEERGESRMAQATADLRDLAQWTGGDLLWVDSTLQAAKRVTDLVSELRQEYLIAIESSGEREWRPLDVRVTNRRVTVRSRSGYFVGDASK